MTIAAEHFSVLVPSLTHLLRLTDDVGIIQHATFDMPNHQTGYCTDDVARAFIVAIDSWKDTPVIAERLESIYLRFLQQAQRADGKFHNFMSYDRQWLDEIGDGDAIGRAMWALGYGEHFAARRECRELCRRMLDRAVVGSLPLPAIHSMSFAALGLTYSYVARGRADQDIQRELGRIGQRLMTALASERTESWRWFEPHLTYDNGRLPEALLRIGMVLQCDEYIAAGLDALIFYREIVLEEGLFVPIGSDGWYQRGQARARYPQQPLEAASMIDAASVAYALTHDELYRTLAMNAYEWFIGRNDAGISLLRDGGCADGIDTNSINENMGAESTISYLAATYSIRNFGR